MKFAQNEVANEWSKIRAILKKIIVNVTREKIQEMTKMVEAQVVTHPSYEDLKEDSSK